MSMRPIVYPLLCLSLVGCGTWSKPGSTEAEFHRDRYECEREAALAYPVHMQGGEPIQTASTTNCTRGMYGQFSCTTNPGVNYAPAATDVNAIPRAMAFPSCLRARGYERK